HLRVAGEFPHIGEDGGLPDAQFPAGLGQRLGGGLRSGGDGYDIPIPNALPAAGVEVPDKAATYHTDADSTRHDSPSSFAVLRLFPESLAQGPLAAVGCQEEHQDQTVDDLPCRLAQAE